MAHMHMSCMHMHMHMHAHGLHDMHMACIHAAACTITDPLTQVIHPHIEH